MAWWQLRRRNDDSATVTDSGASPDGMGSVDHGPVVATALGASPAPVIHRVPDAESTAAVTRSPEPQGWRLLPPPELLAHQAIPVTANMAVQRSLAAHIPVTQLAMTARPLGHERRADGPIGIVASVLRTVSGSAEALLPATHMAGPDLVLRRKTAPGEGPLAEGYPAQTPRPRPSVSAPVDSSFEFSTSAASSSAPLMSASETRSEPAPGPMVLRTLATTSPLLSDFTSTTSLMSVPSSAVPSLAASVASSSLIARTPGRSGAAEDVSPRDMAVAARQRRVIEVRSAQEPASLSDFAASYSPSVVARRADAVSLPPPDSVEAAPPSSSDADGGGRFGSSAGPSTAPRPEIRPTVGRRVGLGMPMNALPSSAISRLPESDPFAGWNESEMPLAPGASASPGSGGGAAPAFQSESGAAGSAAVRRTAVAPAPVSGALASQSTSSLRGTVSADTNESTVTDESTGTEPESDAVPALVLSGLVEHAPLVGHRRLDRSLDESLAPVSVAGTERGVTSVPVRWKTGSDAPSPGTRPGGGVGPVSPINRSVDAPRVPSSSSWPGQIGRTNSAGPELLQSSSVSSTSSTGSVGSSRAPSAVSLQRSTEYPVRSSEPVGSGGTVRSTEYPVRSSEPVGSGGTDQGAPTGAGWLSNAGAFRPASTALGSFGSSHGASEPSDFGAIGRSEDASAASLRPWPDPSSIQSLLVAGSGTGSAFGQFAGPVLRTPSSSAGQASTLTVVNMNRVAAQTSSTAALKLQRESQLGTAPASGRSANGPVSSEQANGDAEMSPTPASNGEGGSTAASVSDAGGGSGAEGAAGASGPTSAQADAELDRLAGKLYERIRQRLRRELLDDRERAGFALDGMR